MAHATTSSSPSNRAPLGLDLYRELSDIEVEKRIRSVKVRLSDSLLILGHHTAPLIGIPLAQVAVWDWRLPQGGIRPEEIMFTIDSAHLSWCLDNLVRGTPANRIRIPRDTAHWADLALRRIVRFIDDVRASVKSCP
jgi:hypothetical protein